MAETVSMPKLGFDMAEGVLVRWVKQENDQIKKGDVIAEIETDKATVEVESSFSGIVAKHLVEAGSSVPVGAPIAVISEVGEKIEEVTTRLPSTTQPADNKVKDIETVLKVELPSSDQSQHRHLASPLARRIAAEKQVNLSEIHGSGPNGRIVRQDIDAFLSKAKVPQKISDTTIGGSPVAAADQLVPLTKLRLAIARRMSEAKQTIPHFYVTHLYHADRLTQFRAEYNNMVTDEEKLSVNDLILKATAMALRKFPGLNASMTENGLVLHQHINLGMAVSVEGGLLTVVIRDIDNKDLKTIAAEGRSLVIRAREGKVRPEDIEGSTFSISNLGMFDVENFAAIINPPESAILAVGSIHEVVSVMDGEMAVEKVFKATLSADHRVTDGVAAAQFLQEIARYIENPVGLMILD